MLRLLKEIWPAALPLLFYAGWMLHTRKRWVEGPWFWAVMASIAIAVTCLLLLGASEEGIKGVYVPPHMENGRLVPGRVGE